jgi:DNA topoisomerase-1
MQQEAARKLGFSAKQTMMYAQQLYEGVELGEDNATGLITYMRTDSVNLSEQALASAQETIKDKYGKDYLLDTPRKYTARSKNAQEAHEAIRPTDLMRDPESVKDFLDRNQHRLYDLIWKRTISTQMPEAVFDATAVDTEIKGDKTYTFRSNGQVIKFDGFMKVYLEGTDDEEAEEEGLLPELSKGDKPKVVKILPKQHFTQPPPRFTDASLIKAMEELGIGRPSTYAPTISTIQERDYVQKIDKKFSPTEIGFIVNDILVEHFPNVVDFNLPPKWKMNSTVSPTATKSGYRSSANFILLSTKTLRPKKKTWKNTSKYWKKNVLSPVIRCKSSSEGSANLLLAVIILSANTLGPCPKSKKLSMRIPVRSAKNAVSPWL